MISAVRRGMRGLHRRMPPQHFWPIILLLGTCFGCTFGLLFLNTSGQDTIQHQREEQALVSAIETTAEMVRHDLQDYAKWDDAVRHVGHGVDPEWIDDNIVAFLGKTQGYTHVYVLNGLNETVYSFPAQPLGQVGAAATLGGDFAASTSAVRAMPRDGSPIVSGFTRQGRTVSVYSTAAIVPLTQKVTLPSGPTMLLVIAQKIDEPFLRRITKELALQDVRLSLAPPRNAGAAVPIRNAEGQAIAWIEWRPHRPGSKLLRELAPTLAIMAFLAVLAAILIIRRASRSIEALRESELRARHHAYHDLLTGLPNRRALAAEVSEHLYARRKLSLLFMDLDGFKDANDVYGHPAGDMLLNEAAKRIQDAVPGSFVARAGGDEFAVLLVAPNAGITAHAGAAILERFREPFAIGAYRVNLGISIGCTTAAGSGTDSHDELIRQADIAMYAAKIEGKNRSQAYHPALDEGHRVRMRLENDLREAVAREELFVRFQPIVDASTRQIVAVEALARWSHPDHGDVPPDVFIPIAEISGLINEIGRQILFQACTAIRNVDVELAVNLSPAQFWDGNLVDSVRAVLAETGFPPERLELEITETLLIKRPETAAQIINDLRALGIRIALDDFGTGFASIGYLQHLQLDRIKIDKAFIAPLHQSARSREMLVSIVALAKAFGLAVCAEGIETEGQAEIALGAGCGRLQGWLFGRPTTVAELRYLEKTGSDWRSAGALLAD